MVPAKQKSQARTMCDMGNRRERTCLDCGRKFTLIHSQKWLGLNKSLMLYIKINTT